MTDRDDERNRPDEPERAAAEPEPEPEPEARRGQIRFQDAETTTPRAPTLGEQRARKRALEQERARELAEQDEAQRKSRLRRRILIGSGVTVGVVALVAVWYAAATPDEVTANCVDNNGVLAANEDFCDENYARSQPGAYHSGGFWFIPLPGGGFGQYRYNYGGSVGPDRRVIGGSTAAPGGNTTVKTQSGRTVQRGGFGISSGGKSGGS
jgi:hypothetical protein